MQQRRQRLRVGYLVSRISRLGGGVSEAVVQLGSALKNSDDLQLFIFAGHDAFTDDDCQRLEGVRIFSAKVRGFKAFNFVPGLYSAVLNANLDLLHLHGIWQYPSAVAAMWSSKTRRPYVVSPQGMLDPWILSRGRMKKFMANMVYERRNVWGAALVHAVTDREASEIAAYSPRAHITVIPNAVDVELEVANTSRAPRRATVVYIGRIHPKKNVSAAIDAWGTLSDMTKGWRFVIAGWGEPEHVRAVEAKIRSRNPECNIEYVGPLYGSDKARLLSESSFLLLPSFGEGLPLAVLEAWARGTPTLMSEFCNLPEAYQLGASLCCGVSADTIRVCLREALTLTPEKWIAMSEASLTLVRSRYSSTVIAKKWVQTYRALCHLERED
jgi:glycosyltransferase involved in cell wall biosynthesis